MGIPQQEFATFATFSNPAINLMNEICLFIGKLATLIYHNHHTIFFHEKRERNHHPPRFVKIVKTNSSLIGACYMTVLYLEQFIFSLSFWATFILFSKHYFCSVHHVKLNVLKNCYIQ